MDPWTYIVGERLLLYPNVLIIIEYIDGGLWNWYDDMLEDNNVGMYGELRGFPQAYFSGTFSMTESNKKTHSIDLIGEHKFLTLKVES